VCYNLRTSMSSTYGRICGRSWKQGLINISLKRPTGSQLATFDKYTRERKYNKHKRERINMFTAGYVRSDTPTQVSLSKRTLACTHRHVHTHTQARTHRHEQSLNTCTNAHTHTYATTHAQARPNTNKGTHKQAHYTATHTHTQMQTATASKANSYRIKVMSSTYHEMAG
jgi:hypothetical protein